MFSHYLRRSLRKAAKLRLKRCSCASFATKSEFVDEGLLPAHKPDLVEKGKYEKWLNEDAFKADVNDSKRKVFSMILPPPNVTGSLHLGHTLTAAVQDALARYYRSSCNVLWLPGTDHAGIATQVAVEKYLQKKLGITRHDLGREKFIEEVWKWRERYGTQILEQLKEMGCSLDWSRETFTMDERQTKAVKAAFIKLFDDGLIYRSEELVNWCCHLRTTISDIEVDYKTVTGPTGVTVPGYDDEVIFGLLYVVPYRFGDGSGEVRVATTRPETILGDVALAVNPGDARNSTFIGRTVLNPLTNAAMPVVGNAAVDPDFGTGVLKLTPAHDKLDFRIAKKFGFKPKRVIGDDGLICDGFGEYSNIKRLTARKLIIERLKDSCIVEEVPHCCSIPVCSRSGDVIEMVPKPQWFISMSDMTNDAKAAVDSGTIALKPVMYKTDWDNWLASNVDWCISRQLWWGHQIPAYQCSVNGGESLWIAAEDADSALRKAAAHFNVGITDIVCRQDDDVLDTWFSSALYPFAVLGWPSLTNDFSKFYPLSLIITGNDILLFWVYRMVTLGKKLTGCYPFDKIFLHGVICDDKGAKMSKSKGNVIHPSDIARGASLRELQQRLESYRKDGVISATDCDNAAALLKLEYPNGFPACGYDALRFTLLSRNLESKYINFNPEECRLNSLFCNKIWNSAKYTRHSIATLSKIDTNVAPVYSLFDRWILSRLQNLNTVVKKSIADLNMHYATSALKSFLYYDLCDLYLETTKRAIWAIRDNDSATALDIGKAVAHCETLSLCLDVSLRLLHPFMPFITTELVPKIPHLCDGTITYKTIERGCMQQPDANVARVDETIDGDVDRLREVIEAVRQLKSALKSDKNDKPIITVATTDASLKENIGRYADVFAFMCGVAEVTTDLTILSDSSHVVMEKTIKDGSIVSMVKLNARLTEEELEQFTIREQRLAKKVAALENRINSPMYKATKTMRQEHADKIESWMTELTYLRKLINR